MGRSERRLIRMGWGLDVVACYAPQYCMLCLLTVFLREFLICDISLFLRLDPLRDALCLWEIQKFMEAVDLINVCLIG